MALKKNDKSENKGVRGVWTTLSAKDEQTKESYLSAVWGGIKGGALGFGAAGLFATTVAVGGLAVLDEEYTGWKADYDIANNDNFSNTVTHSMVKMDGNYYMLAQDPEDEDRWRLYIGERNLGGQIELTLVEDHNTAYSVIARMKAVIDVDRTANDSMYSGLDYYSISDISGHYEEDSGINRLVETADMNVDGLLAHKLFTEAQTDIEANYYHYGFSTSPEIVDDPHADVEDFLIGFLYSAGIFGGGLAALGAASGGLAGGAFEGTDRLINRRRKRKDKAAKPVHKP